MTTWQCLGCFTNNNIDDCYCKKCKKISCDNFCWYCENCGVENETITCNCGEKYEGHNQQINNQQMNNQQMNVRMEIRLPEGNTSTNIENILASIFNPLETESINNNTTITINSIENNNDDSDNDINDDNDNSDNDNNNDSDNDNDNDNDNGSDNSDDDEIINNNNLSDSDNDFWKCNICGETNTNEIPICSLCKSLPSSNDNHEWLCAYCGTLETTNSCSSCGSLSFIAYRERITRSRINRILRFINSTIQNTEMKDVEFKITEEELQSIDKIEYSEQHKEIDKSCPICMEEFKLKDQAFYMNNCCKKIIHKECLEIWFQKKYKCPLCRHEFKHEIIK